MCLLGVLGLIEFFSCNIGAKALLLPMSVKFELLLEMHAVDQIEMCVEWTAMLVKFI